MIHANAKSERLVVGPAQLTGSAIKSAKAFKVSTGEWVVSFRLTSKGSAAWNAYAKRQFHALIAIVANGEVYSAPLIQPASTRFTSFGGTGEISGRFTKTDAVDLAKWLVPKK
jgi:preprotein translocase subunit SecD